MTALSRLYPVTSRLAQPFLGRKPVGELAVEVEEIYPAETETLPPVVMLEDDWDKITAVQEETTWEAEKLRSFGGEHTHRPTTRYTFRDVLATPWGCFKAAAAFHQHGKPDLGKVARAPLRHEAAGFFGLPVIGMKYFGHFLRDGLPCSLLRREEEALYFPLNPSWPDTQGYAARLGMERLETELVHFNRLSICSDIGQNRHRHGRIREIYDRIQATLPAKTNDRVFIRRGKTGVARVLLNEDEVAAALEADGFAVCAATDGSEKILATCAGAQMVVTVEGSHWAHAFYAASIGAGHLTLNPSDRFNNQYAAYMGALDLSLATLVVERREGGYVADIDRLRRLIDRLEARLVETA